jgi:hypothetical protein
MGHQEPDAHLMWAVRREASMQKFPKQQYGRNVVHPIRLRYRWHVYTIKGNHLVIVICRRNVQKRYQGRATLRYERQSTLVAIV